MEHCYGNGDHRSPIQQCLSVYDNVAPLHTSTPVSTKSILMKYLLSVSPSDELLSTPENCPTARNHLGNSSSCSTESYSRSGIDRLHGSSISMSPLSVLENMSVKPLRSSLRSQAMKVEEDVLVMDGVLVESVAPGCRRSRSFTDGMSRLPSAGASTFYKTEICRAWEDTGTCGFGVKCRFAHGKEELRPTHVPSKIKSEMNMFKTYSSVVGYSPRNRIVPKVATPPSSKEAAGTLSTSAITTATTTELKQPLTDRLTFGSRKWCPLDDGIDISLPFLDGQPTSKDAVYDYIHGILYGPAQKKRLPVFAAICSE